MPSKPTVRDVAAVAAVSVGTASNALNNRPGVAPRTRARVLDAAQSLGYERSASESTVLGMLMKRDSFAHFPIDPFYSYVLAGAEQEAQHQQVSLMFASVEVDEGEQLSSWPSMLAEQRMAGLLLVGPFPESTIRSIAGRLDLTTVLIDAYAPSLPLSCVLTQNTEGAESAVRYLVEQGHRHIGLIGSNRSSYPSFAERREAFVCTLRYSNLSVEYIEESTPIREAAYDAARRLLQRAPHITAIFACNDNLAIGVMNAAVSLGCTVPGDLSVIGFDDIDLAREVSPALTTVHVDKRFMGVVAVRLLLEHLANPALTPQTTRLGTKLVIRNTVAPPRHRS